MKPLIQKTGARLVSKQEPRSKRPGRQVQTLTYSLNVRRKDCNPPANLSEFQAVVCMLLFSGPIGHHLPCPVC